MSSEEVVSLENGGKTSEESEKDGSGTKDNDSAEG